MLSKKNKIDDIQSFKPSEDGQQPTSPRRWSEFGASMSGASVTDVLPPPPLVNKHKPASEEETTLITEQDIGTEIMKPQEFPVESEDQSRQVLAAYWYQMAKEGEFTMHKVKPSKSTIRKEVERILMNTEVEYKESLYQEVKYIMTHFRQRRCTNYCQEDKKFHKAIKKLGVIVRARELCVCGLAKPYHTQEAQDNPVTKWYAEEHTEKLYPWSFGNMDIPGHKNYLEPPEGTRKYVRFDDLATYPEHLWTLLIKYWKLKSPNLVISVTGGDISSLYNNTLLQQSLREGILKAAITTKAWIITDGFHLGATREISDIFQEHLGRSQWAEYEDHANIPLIGIVPWGVIADRKVLHGIHVGTDGAVYLYKSIQKHSQTAMVPNALDPYHTIYLMPDDGTHGKYSNEPRTRRGLEQFMRTQTLIDVVGAKDVKIPVVILVMGGDHFTLDKLAEATSEKHQISVVIVNNSGKIANMLAETYHKLEKVRPRSHEERYGWSEVENECMSIIIDCLQKEGKIRTTKDKEDLINIMMSRHLVEVFGIGERDTKDLDKAILQATFGGTRDIAVQLTLTLAMNRVDIAKSFIFVESRKPELKAITFYELSDHRVVTEIVKFLSVIIFRYYQFLRNQY